MATNISVFLAQVEILLGAADSNTELSDANIQAQIKAALERYSNDRPDYYTEDESGDGGKYYDIVDLLENWVDGFSQILTIEYPAEAISADDTPEYLEPDDWIDNYEQGGTRYLFLPNHAPAATETMRIRYTVPYTFDGSNDTTTPPQDFYAICHLAAGLCCQAIAAKYSRTSDSTIAADSVNHTSRAAEFSRRAREYIDFYNNHLGLSEGEQAREQGASEFVDLDTSPTWMIGRRYLFHDSRTR